MTQQKPSGQIRQSQILSTFGPGAMVDLPKHSVIIGGLNHWQGKGERLYEERLESRVAKILGVGKIALYQPPTDEEDAKNPKGIKVFIFPTWFVAQTDETFKDKSGKTYRSRPMVPYGQLRKGKYYNNDRDPFPVVPVRFVQACINGHISDIDWPAFAHNESEPCRGQLYLDESGSGNDFAEIFVRCERCNKRRPLANATLSNSWTLGKCEGERPWLGPQTIEECIIQNEENGENVEKTVPNRLLVRSASNAYFSQIISVISIPDNESELKELVNQFYDEDLQHEEDIDSLQKEISRKPKYADLRKFDIDKIWQDIQRRKKEITPATEKSIKQLEIETILKSPPESPESIPINEIFYARTRELNSLPPALDNRLERIILVHRLREVIALVGFTRFESVMTDVDGDLDISVRRASLGLDPDWVPAIENKGEGIFLGFSTSAIKKWEQEPAVKARGRKLYKGFQQWCTNKSFKETPKFLGLPYIMLHSLSHLLITAVSLECGYAATAIRERIYAGEYGYGILLYTGSSGSEGTLGGLVEVGRNIESLIIKALIAGQLCSNDPVCSQHDPSNAQEQRLLHGAVCHGCLLIAETSCERSNDFLDRALVVNTVNESGAAFFPDYIF